MSTTISGYMVPTDVLYSHLQLTAILTIPVINHLILRLTDNDTLKLSKLGGMVGQVVRLVAYIHMYKHSEKKK